LIFYFYFFISEEFGRADAAGFCDIPVWTKPGSSF